MKKAIALLFMSLILGCDIKFQDSTSGILHETPVRITHNGSPKREPAWSPDGSYIAFSTNGITTEFKTVTFDGSPSRRLGSIHIALTGQYDISPDGSFLVFTGTESRTILVADILKQSTEELVTGMTDTQGPTWAPSGDRVAFSALASDGKSRLWTIMIADRSVTQVTTDGGDHLSPTWSPDGSSLAYQDQTDTLTVIKIIDLLNGQTKQLTPDSLISIEPVWAPVGNRIAFAATNANDSTTVRIVNDTSGVLLAEIRGNQSVTNRPAWAFDGSRLAFRVPGGTWIADPAGTILNTTDLTQPYPLWMPNELALVNSARGGHSIIEAINLSDSSIISLTRPSDFQGDFSPAWFPDNRTIAFVRSFSDSQSVRQTLWSVRIPDGEAEPLLGTPDRIGFENNPAISPDGTLMTFDNGTAVFLALTATKQVVDLRPFIGTGLQETAWAPSGDGFVCNSNFQNLKVFTTDSSLVIESETIRGNFRNPVWAGAYEEFGEHIAAETSAGISLISLNRQKSSTILREASSPSWSPDGSRLAFVWREQVHVMKLLFGLPGE